jgi:lambda family phage portal protein
MNDRARLNLVDRMVAYMSPRAGFNRLKDRMVLAHYDAAKPSPSRKARRDNSSADTLVGKSAEALRNNMRYLDRNHDLVNGALSTMVNNIVGPTGITPEPQPQNPDGSVHTAYALALTEAYNDWARRPEVTWSHDQSQTQRLICRSWLRDGEAFVQRLIGPVPYLDHGTRVPYSQELMEADMVPMHYDNGSNIRQGIQRNAWGRAMLYWVLKDKPGDMLTLAADAVKSIEAGRMLHIAVRERIGQLRGISKFASVITRMEDLKDFEESERVAAKVAAMLCAYVKRQAPMDAGYEEPVDPSTGEKIARSFGMAPGMIIDTLVAGEEIGMIDTKRPNPNLIAWRDGQLRAFAAGIGASYSSISRNYDGTYSAQRQELVEQWVNYAALTDQFVEMYTRPTWEDFVLAADLSGVVPTPRGIKPGTAANCLYVAPSMPWIDPLKEISAWVMAVQAGFASEYEVMRKRGVSPDEVMRQIKAWRTKTADQGLVFNSDAAVAAANNALHQALSQNADQQGQGGNTNQNQAAA